MRQLSFIKTSNNKLLEMSFFTFFLILSFFIGCTPLKPVVNFENVECKVSDLIIDTGLLVYKIDFNFPVNSIKKGVKYEITPFVIINDKEKSRYEKIRICGYNINSEEYKAIDTRYFQQRYEYIDSIKLQQRMEKMLIYLERNIGEFESEKTIALPNDTLLEIKQKL